MRNFEDLQIAVAGTGYGSVERSRWSFCADYVDENVLTRLYVSSKTTWA